MTVYLLWQSKIRGKPHAVLLRDRSTLALNEFERTHAIGSALAVRPEHVDLGLLELEALYPCPPIAAEPVEPMRPVSPLLDGLKFNAIFAGPKRIAQPPKAPAMPGAPRE